MSLLFWRNNRAIDSFATVIANEIYASVQPQVAREFYEGDCDKKTAAKIEKNLNAKLRQIVIKIKDFKAVNHLGIYGKARLHLKFRERLQELGYSKMVSTKLNEILMFETP